MGKKVIYTCLIGNYDPLIEHSYRMNGWDYICFVDKITKYHRSNLWQFKLIPNKINDKVKLSRLPKILPNSFLSDYDYSIYIDANIEIVNNTLEKKVNELIEQNVKIAIAPHPQRDCVYEEANFCILKGKDKKIIIKKQIQELYEKNNFPYHFGLFQNNIIYRQHNKIVKLNEIWWSTYKKYSRRDQLSFVFALWCTKINCVNLFDPGFNVRESPDGFKFYKHEIPYTTNKLLLIRKKVRYFLKKNGLLDKIHKIKKRIT